MTPKTYYGPWLQELPADAPDGSLWQMRQRNAVHDGTPRLNAVTVVCLAGNLFDLEGYVPSYGVESVRRVYPPGSVLPEPRPLVVDGQLRDLSESKWWMIELYHSMPSWSLHDETSVKSMFGGHVGLLLLSTKRCYPVDPLPSGAYVPIPWPDSGCTTE